MARYYPNGSNKKRTQREEERQEEINDAVIPNPQFTPEANDLADLLKGDTSYSDYTSKRNGATDGWYSVLLNSIPFVKDLHNAMLGRESAKDYLDNNGLSWEDMRGYNDIKLLSRATSGTSNLASSGVTWLSNIGSDLGKLYSGQKS